MFSFAQYVTRLKFSSETMNVHVDNLYRHNIRVCRRSARMIVFDIALFSGAFCAKKNACSRTGNQFDSDFCNIVFY